MTGGDLIREVKGNDRFRLAQNIKKNYLEFFFTPLY